MHVGEGFTTLPRYSTSKIESSSKSRHAVSETTTSTIKSFEVG